MKSGNKEYTHFDILGYRYSLPLKVSGSKTKEHILMEATILFAKNGYAAVSMRDLAEVIGIKPASLYNHFDSKEALWDAVLDHTVELYKLYFKQLGEALDAARSFEDGLDILFSEPIQLKNLFTCYAFGLVQTEQFRDKRAGEVFNGTFLEFSIGRLKGWFDKCVDNQLARPFDTRAMSTLIMHSVLIGLNVKVQETMGRATPYDPSEMFTDLRNFILGVVSGNGA
jgi:Transcriptional regulator